MIKEAGVRPGYLPYHLILPAALAGIELVVRFT